MSSSINLKEIIRKYALLNAVSHEGKAQQGSVIGKLLAEMPQLKARVREIMPLVAEIVKEPLGNTLYHSGVHPQSTLP